MARPIYVEIDIGAPIDALWSKTQTPDLHERWDLRFTSIRYLPRVADEPQRFVYETRIGFGLRIAGGGETVGEHAVDGKASSALKFWSDDPKSLILRGSGYWKYIDRGDGRTTFLTLYDYEPRWGPIGRLLDGILFRPLFGWATAWSFDRLRLWIERGIDPTLSATRALIDAVSSVALAFGWMYQGAVPKLLARDPREIELAAAALPRMAKWAPQFVTAAACVEIALGLMMLLWRSRWAYVASAAALVGVTAPAFVSKPGLFTEAFNPATLTACMLALCAIGWISHKHLPSARNCKRTMKGTQP
ncbi:MAG: hypothetical protein K2Y21_07035 [Phycisphaerales bacterium]|nr:hypothetical protein [Phycisphaerales bacterium]